MNALAHYLMAQAVRQPVATLRFAAAEAWRRGRVRWADPIAGGLPAFAAWQADWFAPFLAPEISLAAPAGGRFSAAADAICRHEFQLLGSTYRAGKTIDWHKDWVSGHRWPCEPAGRLNFSSSPAGSDVKRPWELSRFHHALLLGAAYWETSNQRYAEEFASQLRDWIAQNPYPRGIHWAMPMEIGIRLANLCVAGRMFSHSDRLPRTFWQEFLSLLFLHGRHLAKHREWNPVARGNHYLGCLVGMLHAGALFLGFPEGREWYHTAKAAIGAEMNWQIGEDGVADEGSSAYHGLVTEMMLVSALLAARVECAADFASDPLAAIRRTWRGNFCAKLESMFDFPVALLTGRRQPPILGDSDDGRLLPLCDHSDVPALEHVLATGRALFGRTEWPVQHECQQPGWLLNYANAGRRPSPPRKAFPVSGFFFATSPRIQASVRCGPLGVAGWANHAHCDQLHVEFALDGAPVLVDPGTYLYSGNPEARNALRSSRAHNSPVVAGAEQNRFWDDLLFRMVDDTRSKLLHWEETSNSIRFAGRHSGYLRLAQRVEVQRTVVLDRDRHSLEICDTLAGRDSVPVEWFWQFAPGIQIGLASRPAEPSGVAGENELQRFTWIAGPVKVCAKLEGVRGPAHAAMQDGWFAPRYDVRLAAPAIHIRCQAEKVLKAKFRFALV